MTIKDALIFGNKKLHDKKIVDPAESARILLGYSIKKSPEFLYSYPEKILTKAQQKTYFNLIDQRGRGLPIAYLIQQKNFFGLTFFVSPAVLIPRPETEILVEEALTIIKKNPQIQTIADIGCGSGAIICAIAKKTKNKKLLATEISLAAISVAKKNFKKNKAEVKLFRGDLLKPLYDKKPDLICANLPYLDKKTYTQKLKFEPKKALYSDQTGLAVYEKFIKQLVN
jgi:release factor glutamine methyltransferase